MNRYFFIFLLFTFHFSFAEAQDSQRKGFDPALSLGAELALPIGKFGNVYSFAAGISAMANVPVGKKTGITLNSGYINYFLSDNYGGGSDGYIPLLAGVEQMTFSKFFVSIQSGIIFRTHGLGNAFAYSAGMGIKISKNLSALMKYTAKIKYAINSGAIGIRAAYIFGR